MQPYIDKETEFIISSLESAGFSAFAVGGCIRDALLGIEVNDFDITTSALPQETKVVFASFPVIETGIKHGTVTVVINKKPYEVTTFRVESEYKDCRHPDKVSFVKNIESDLSRRDFTINAIAFSPKKGIVDAFGGVDDLSRGIIRAVGDPHLRFKEDALRILRALRFSATLGFEIEENTATAIFELSDNLSKVSSERIYNELKRLICGKNAVSVISRFSLVIKKIIPLGDEFSSLNRLPENPPMRFAYLCGEYVETAMNILKADSKTANISKLLAFSSPIPKDTIALKKYISRNGRENSLLLAEYRRRLYSEDEDNQTEALLNGNECLFIKDLAIKGTDLLKLGIKGKNIGEKLNDILNAVIEGRIENNLKSILDEINC